MEQKLVRGFAGGNELPMESQSSYLNSAKRSPSGPVR